MALMADKIQDINIEIEAASPKYKCRTLLVCLSVAVGVGAIRYSVDCLYCYTYRKKHE